MLEMPEIPDLAGNIWRKIREIPEKDRGLVRAALRFAMQNHESTQVRECLRSREIESQLDCELIIKRACRERMGFLTAEEIDVLAESEKYRLQMCLVRCGRSRFTCSAQDVKFMIEAIEKNGDYCRDVAIPAEDPIWEKLPWLAIGRVAA
jgi:hypothetical protein